VKRILLLLPLIVVVACERREGSTATRMGASPAPTRIAAGAAASSSTDSQRLVGRWLRGDSDYVIEIAGVAPDGTLDARYRNPNPIHVSRAESRREAGVINVRVELRDRGYPGSYYTLTYDPGSDSLTGVYRHLGLNRDFDVVFTRLATTGGEPPAATTP